jgi:hypothetical protein
MSPVQSVSMVAKNCMKLKRVPRQYLPNCESQELKNNELYTNGLIKNSNSDIMMGLLQSRLKDQAKLHRAKDCSVGKQNNKVVAANSPIPFTAYSPRIECAVTMPNLA